MLDAPNIIVANEWDINVPVAKVQPGCMLVDHLNAVPKWITTRRGRRETLPVINQAVCKACLQNIASGGLCSPVFVLATRCAPYTIPTV
jgi:hypothetical protein